MMLEINFDSALWLCPVAYGLHILDEYPRLVGWVQRHINPQFTAAHYRRVHLTGLVTLIIAPLAHRHYPSPQLTLALFTWLLTPGFFCNVFFHAGASFRYRSYSPGLMTAMVIYLPFYGLLCQLAWRDGRLDAWQWLISTVLAALLHFVEVRHNVIRYRPTGSAAALTAR